MAGGDDENPYSVRHRGGSTSHSTGRGGAGGGGGPEAGVISEDLHYGRPFCSYKVKCISCCSAFVVVASLFIAILASSIHKVNEGRVGIYLKYGALQDRITDPGMHTKAPFVTEVREISIRPETDTLRTIYTITKDGIPNSFNGVQVRISALSDKITLISRASCVDRSFRGS